MILRFWWCVDRSLPCRPHGPAPDHGSLTGSPEVYTRGHSVPRRAASRRTPACRRGRAPTLVHAFIFFSIMKSSSLFLSLAFSSWLFASNVSACDICGIYTPSLDITPDQLYSWHVSLAERFTHYGTIQDNGHEIGNPLDQHL